MGRGTRSIIAVLSAVVVALAIVVVVLLAQRSGNDERPGAGGASASTNAGPTSQPSASVPSYSGSPPRSEQQLLAGRGGFGGGVTGGAGGRVVHVTTSAESGAGSLRAAVAGDASKWVVFDQDVSITLTSPIKVGSNTTIDGRGHQVDISGPGTSGLELENVKNVIIESLTMSDFGDVSKTDENDLPDAIHLDGSTGVWIDHNDLSIAGDKLIAISAGSSGITVSWNHFHDQEQTMQVGNQATAKLDAKQTVTVDHNFFDHTGLRMPVVSYGRAHVYNNYYLDWGYYAVRAERGGQVYLEANVFDGSGRRPVTRIKPGDNGCNDQKTRCDDSPGYLHSLGNSVIGARPIKESLPSEVFNPSKNYSYRASSADKGLSKEVAADAGPQSK